MTEKDKEITELRAKLADAERYGKTEFGIEQILRKDLEEANNLRRAAEAELAALRERERWIPVSERMPPDAPKKSWKDRGEKYKASEQVEAYNGSRYVAEVLTNPKGESVWVCGDETLTKVTHWKALSAAPERGKGK